MKTLTSILLISIFVFGCNTKTREAKESENDFDILCLEFLDISKTQNFSSLSPEQRAEKLDEKLEKSLKSDSAARLAWQAIQNAPPSERSNLFVIASKDSGLQDWHCDAIEKYASEIGSNYN